MLAFPQWGGTLPSTNTTMSKDLAFRYSVPRRPEGEALTFDEIKARFLKQLQEKDGNCVQSLINLAKVYAQTERYYEAFRCVERLIVLSDDPEKHAAYYLALGAFMEKRGDFQGAARFYRQAFGLEPCRTETWYFIHNNLGYSLNQLGHHDEAIPYLRHAIEIDPDRPNAYKNLGLAMEAMGRFAEAAGLFIAATQANAADPRSLAHLENMMASHPELEVDLPDLRYRLEACREAVKSSRAQQPDFPAIWARDRQKQKRE
jgi:tetratricopeptide (TPR) repeat protein